MRNAEDPETGEYYDDEGYAWTDYNTYVAANSDHPEWGEFRNLMDDLLNEASGGKWKTREDEEE